MVARRMSITATGGPMLNPSVEPLARRESEQFRRGSNNGGPLQHLGASTRASCDRASDAGDDRSVAALSQASEAASSLAAMDARNQRRSIGLQRLSVNDHMKESLELAQAAIDQGAGTAIQTTGLQKLQDIMTEAKQKGIGVSKLFNFFLAPSELTDRHGVNLLRLLEKSARVPEETADADGSGEVPGGVHKETLSSKTRAEAAKNSRASNSKKKSMELMPSLQKGKRPSTASSKRGSTSTTGSARGAPASARETDPGSRGGSGGGSAVPGSRNSLARRSSSLDESTVRDAQITPTSFQAGLTTLGFKMTDEETTVLFNHLDDNKNGQIDLAEFTRFCLEIPSMAWKAERVRRGVHNGGTSAEADRELDKAARDMANETVNGSDGMDGAGGAGRGKLETAVTLGKVVYKGDKFFWRTKELIEVVIQLNARVGFMAVSTFHTEALITYPIIFVDPSKIPINAAAVAALLEELETKELEIKKEAEMRRVGEAGGAGNAEIAAKKEEEERSAKEQSQTLAEQVHMGYIADYLLHRITMPDQDGNILQPDVTQPGVQVNPSLSSGNTDNQEESEKRVSGTGGIAAARRPGLMRTTFDEWDTLLFPKPPSVVADRPKFGAKKRDSYFEEFQNKKEEFDNNRIRAHRLSAEAAAYTEEVSNLMRKLAPLNYSASAPATLREDNLQAGAGDPLTDLELNARPGSGRILLADDISQATLAKRSSGMGNSLLESQSAPVLQAPESAAA